MDGSRGDMSSVSLAEERDRLQRQVDQLERNLCVGQLQLLSSDDTDGESDSDTDGDSGAQSEAGLLAQRQKIQREIQNLEQALGPDSHIGASDDDDDDGSSSGSELGLSTSVESCLQMNLVYQEVIQEKLQQLETLLTQNRRQQEELVSQLSGPIREAPREQAAAPASSSSASYQQPISMYLGRFLKPYFKDKLTGLGPPANQETKERTSRMTGCLDEKKQKIRRWESWQKTLLIHAVSGDSLRRHVQPKLSKLDYLTQKLTDGGADKQHIQEQIEALENDIQLLREKKEEDLIGGRHDDHDWDKISNIDFEGTRTAEDIRLFWQNFLHPAINKSRWSQQEVKQLEDISRRHRERHWDRIAAQLGSGRTAFMCLQTFQRFVTSTLKRRCWTPAEDAQLRELVDKMRIGNFIPYTQMSYFMEGRDPGQLLYRWSQVLHPGLKRGHWTKEEDKLLLQAVARHGEKNWWKIRLEVPGRSDGACRDRYQDCLKAGTKKGAFDPDEQELLVKLVEKHGVGHWAKIAAEIPNRYDAQCLRAWRKMNRYKAAPARKRGGAARPAEEDKGKRKRRVPVAPPTRKRRRRVKVEESSGEEEEEEEEEEEDEQKIVYMDSEEDKAEGLEEKEEEEEKEEKEERVPPLHEWAPAERVQPAGCLRFRPVSLERAAGSGPQKLVRSTVVEGRGGRLTAGPPPARLQWEEQEGGGAMMMVSDEQLKLYFESRGGRRRTGLAAKGPDGEWGPALRSVGKAGGGGGGELLSQLQAAVVPLMGNLLIPLQGLDNCAAALRRSAESRPLSSTAVFLFFLQTMNVDSSGCRGVIQQRAPPSPAPRARSAPGPPRTPSGPRPEAKPLVLLLPAPPLVVRPLPLRGPPLPVLLPKPPAPAPRPPVVLLRVPPVFQVPASSAPRRPTSCLRAAAPPALPALPPSGQRAALSSTSGFLREHDYASSPAPPGGECPQSGKALAVATVTSPPLALRPSPLPALIGAKPLQAKVLSCVLPLERGAPPAVALPPLRPPAAPPVPDPASPLRSGGPPAPTPGSGAALQFQPSLVFLERRAEVLEWLRAANGPRLPAAGAPPLPYLPPFVSSLDSLCALLRSAGGLARSGRLLLRPQQQQPQRQHPQQQQPRTSAESPELPDSTSDLDPSADGGKSVSSDRLLPEEEEAAVRRLVRERFGGNPTFQLLKARFLSCFTVPAFLATLQPTADEEEEVENNQEAEIGVEEERGKKRRRKGCAKEKEVKKPRGRRRSSAEDSSAQADLVQTGSDSKT